MVELAIAGVVLAVIVGKSLVKNHDWHAVAGDLGLDYSRFIVGSRTLDGTFRGFQVHVREISKDQKTMIRVEVHGVDPGFTLRRDGAFARMMSPDIEIGSSRFDHRIRVQGDEDRAVACLDDETRSLVEQVFTDDGGKVADGQLETVIRYVEAVPNTLRPMIRLAEKLRRPSTASLPKRLAHQALNSRWDGVRLTAFRRLRGRSGDDRLVLATARELLGHSSAALRLEACRALGGEREDAERVAKVLTEVARSRRNDSTMRREALETLVGSPRRDIAVRALIASLDSDSQDVQLAAIEGLGRIGDLDAVSRLRRLAEFGQLFRSAVARAAEQAIEDIKGRAGGTQAGEISLVSVGSLEGAVSPAEDRSEDDRGGEVSLA